MATPLRASSGCLVALSLCWLAACGGDSPARPSSTGPTVTTVEVGVAGNAAAQLAPGETRQLFARANRSDGTTIDVTNLATWQSSNPSIATVSNGGVLTAAAEGAVDVFATHDKVRGALRAEIRGCEVVVSPAASSFSAFGGTQTVDVVASTTECRWTARGDAGWFPFAYEPARAGSGSFTFNLPPNSTTAIRSANIIVTSANGATASHAITEARPAGCSYVAQPEEATFSAAGGSGSFQLVATPGDCRWNATSTLNSLGVFITSGFSGMGNGRITYSVQAHARTVDVDGYIEIAGLSGQNPPGRHHIIILKR